MGIYLILFCFSLALAISVYEVPVIVKIVKKLNLLDHPGERSSATESVPTLGGIAIFISFILASAIGLYSYELPEMTYIVAALIVIFFIGLTDDIVNLSPLKKFSSQIIVAGMLIFLADIHFTNLHGIFGIKEIGTIPGSLISCFTIIVIINAFNLIDGVDGLAAGLTILIASAFGGWFLISGHFNYAILSFSLSGATAGFFFYNVYGVKNKIFMGDTGSLVLGTIISILVIQFNEFNIDHSQPYAIKATPAISFGILSYPLMDMIRVITIRLVHLRRPFQADKNHFHHRLLTLGLSHRLVTYSIIGFNILFILTVFYLQRFGIFKLTVSISLACVILVMIPAYFIKKYRLIKKNDPVQQLLIPGSETIIPDYKIRIRKIKNSSTTNK